MADSDDDRDGRNSAAKGYVLATQVMSIGLQMAIPPGIGWWLDQKYSTAPWLTVVGVLFGFSIAMLELLKIAKNNK
jgi:F0F1-type ATP synthase assembly protein I